MIVANERTWESPYIDIDSLTNFLTKVHLIDNEATEIATTRQLRLIACGWARTHIDRVKSKHVLALLDASEDFADRRFEKHKLGFFRRQAESDIHYINPNSTGEHGSSSLILKASHTEDVRCFANFAGEGMALASLFTAQRVLREVIGNPFRKVAEVSEEMRRDKENLVGNMALTTYLERQWCNLPILADALEDAGYTDQFLLQHLRGFERCFKCWGKGKVDTRLPTENAPPLSRQKRTRAGLRGGAKTARQHTSQLTDCEGCKGKGWVEMTSPHQHIRGCWALDYVLGYQHWNPSGLKFQVTSSTDYEYE